MQQTHAPQPNPFDRIEREREARLERAGVRRAASDARPTSTFVAVETAVLVMVAALAMTSIIVTANEPDGDGTSTRGDRVTHPVAGTRLDGARRDALYVAR